MHQLSVQYCSLWCPRTSLNLLSQVSVKTRHLPEHLQCWVIVLYLWYCICKFNLWQLPYSIPSQAQQQAANPIIISTLLKRHLKAKHRASAYSPVHLPSRSHWYQTTVFSINNQCTIWREFIFDHTSRLCKYIFYRVDWIGAFWYSQTETLVFAM